MIIDFTYGQKFSWKKKLEIRKNSRKNFTGAIFRGAIFLGVIFRAAFFRRGICPMSVFPRTILQLPQSCEQEYFNSSIRFLHLIEPIIEQRSCFKKVICRSYICIAFFPLSRFSCFTLLLYFSYIILFALHVSFRTTYSSLAKTILQLWMVKNHNVFCKNIKCKVILVH